MKHLQAGPLREQFGPGTNINTGLSFNKGLVNCSCRVLSNYKWMSVWYNCSETAFLPALFFSSNLIRIRHRCLTTSLIKQLNFYMWGNRSSTVIISCLWNNIRRKVNQKTKCEYHAMYHYQSLVIGK